MTAINLPVALWLVAPAFGQGATEQEEAAQLDGASHLAIFFGILLPMLLLAWPLTYVPAFLKLPKINDVTTDVAAPPRFVTLAKLRTGEANPATYPGARFATEQQKAYLSKHGATKTGKLVRETLWK